MATSKQTEKNNEPAMDVKKENADLGGITAATDKAEGEAEVNKQISESSRLHESGKTDNTDAE